MAIALLPQKFKPSKTLHLFLLLFVIMFSVIIGDNISETLLLSYYSAEKLPLMFIANSVGLLITSLFVMGSIDKWPRFKFFALIAFILILSLTVIRICGFFNIRQGYLALFSIAYVGKILLFLSFWTVANDLCNSSEAKKLFPKIGAGGVLGGIGASFFTAWLSKIYAPLNALFVWIFLLAVAIYLMQVLSKQHKAELAIINENSGKKEEKGSTLKETLN